MREAYVLQSDHVCEVVSLDSGDLIAAQVQVNDAVEEGEVNAEIPERLEIAVDHR